MGEITHRSFGRSEPKQHEVGRSILEQISTHLSSNLDEKKKETSPSPNSIFKEDIEHKSSIQLDSNKGKEKCRTIYAEQYEKGFRFAINVEDDKYRIEKRTSQYEEQGLEVFVGERAFGRDGREIYGLRAILIRDKPANCQ